MRINIIGAGIGGLMAAITLRRKGHEVQVFEASPVLRPIGAGIIVASNAMQLARRVGLADAISAAGIPLAAFGIADHRGQVLQQTDMQRIKTLYGEPSVAIRRSALHDILLQAQVFPPHLGKRLLQVQQQPGSPVELRFEDGTHAESDLVIGADGLRSATRRAIFGECPLRYSSHTCWRGIVPHVIDRPEEALELWGTTGGKRVAMIQVSAEQVYFYYTEKQASGFQVPTPDALAYLRQQFQEFPESYQQLLAKADPSSLFHDDLYDLKPLPHWHHERVVLIGDAAHATTPNLGQGACQAIEDAWYLAEFLETHAEPLAAFQAYEQFRRPKVNYVVNTSYWVGQMSNLGGSIGHRLRNWLLRQTPASVNAQQMERLFRLN